nr:uncharacterized protein LOC129152390 [Nothobranchius furzeri]XP_054586274.1 uncharacterized protein LOC129152390 [Nothobranchius furzeri]
MLWKVMDNPAADGSRSTWMDQNGWPTSSSQGLVNNPLTSSQHLRLHSLCDQTSFYTQQQASGQSCMSSVENSQNAAHLDTIPSNSLFYSTPNPSAPHLMSFAQQVPHTSSMQVATRRGKSMSPSSLPQPNHATQPFMSQNPTSLSANNSYETFQTQLLSQGLANRLPDQSFNMTSCEQNVNMSQATFGRCNVESAGQSSNCFNSSTSQQPAQWMPSSHTEGAVNESVSVDKVPSRETDRDKRRSLVLNRAQLLQQLENINKLLESLPPEDSDDEPEQETASRTEARDVQQGQAQEEEPQISADCSSSGDVEPRSPASPAQSEEMAKDRSGSEEGDNSDYAPESDGHVSECQSEASVDSEGGHSDPPSPTNEEKDESEEEKNSSPPKNNCKGKKKRLEEIVVLPKEDGKKARSDEKRNYCLFCSKAVIKMARHLTTFHCEQAEVAVAFKYPPHSIERKRIWNKLIKKGNFAHNKDVLETGVGQLIARRRMSTPAKAADFIHCAYCHGLFLRKDFWRHMRNCPEKVKEADGPPRKRKLISSHYVLQSQSCEDLSEGFKNLLCEMHYDSVTQAVMEDRVLLQFGEQMFSESSDDGKNNQYIRQSLRQVARLLLEAQKSTPIQTLEDFFQPSNFKHVLSAVKSIAGYDPEKKTFTLPSLAFKVGYHLRKICSVVEHKAADSGDAKAVEACEAFQSLYHKKWNKHISSCALKDIKESKRKNEHKLPLAEDVKLLHHHMEKAHHAAEEKLKENICRENYVALVKAVLARTIAFNQRMNKEVASISITAFRFRKKTDELDDIDESVSDLEKALCGYFSRVSIKGNCGRMLPVLLKPSFESAIELLISVREECGVPKDNPFVFARPTLLSAYRGSDSFLIYLKECGAKNLSTLRFVKTHHRFSTMLQLLHLSDDEKKQIFGTNNPIQTLQQEDVTCDDVDTESEASHHKAHPKWDEAEVQAVEKHLKGFIEEHKLPQKDDCLRCLEAEPGALRSRSWKAVKHYVRNRITALQRQGSSSEASRRTRKKRRLEGSQRTSVKSQRSKRQVVTEHPRGTCSPTIESGDFSQERESGETSSNKTSDPKPNRSREKGLWHKAKPKWDEAEVVAVEKHLMCFITEHKLPQKDDCVRCLEAEPHALRNRSWKGVKDYVRNRITALTRQRGSSKKSKRRRPGKLKEPRQSAATSEPSNSQETVTERQNVDTGLSSEPANPGRQQKRRVTTKTTATPKSDQAKGLQQKAKHKWDEEEIRAVEEHLMHFIKKQKVPQKDDCVLCLEAEPDALRNRSWKGIKDYVRNRITTLQRQSGSSTNSAKYYR